MEPQEHQFYESYDLSNLGGMLPSNLGDYAADDEIYCWININPSDSNAVSSNWQPTWLQGSAMTVISMPNPLNVVEATANAHPLISLNPAVLGGIPHIAGTRLSVGQLLGRIYVLGSIQEVANYYRGDVSVDQIKEAVAYAQDFIEAVCEPSDTNAR